MARASVIQRLWRGETPLAEAFWSYAILGGLALNVTATLAAYALFTTAAPLALGLLVYALPIPYNLFVMVAVWRSADNYQGPRQWADLARVAVAAWTVAVCVL